MGYIFYFKRTGNKQVSKFLQCMESDDHCGEKENRERGKELWGVHIKIGKLEKFSPSR